MYKKGYLKNEKILCYFFFLFYYHTLTEEVCNNISNDNMIDRYQEPLLLNHNYKSVKNQSVTYFGIPYQNSDSYLTRLNLLNFLMLQCVNSGQPMSSLCSGNFVVIRIFFKNKPGNSKLGKISPGL